MITDINAKGTLLTNSWNVACRSQVDHKLDTIDCSNKCIPASNKNNYKNYNWEKIGSYYTPYWSYTKR